MRLRIRTSSGSSIVNDDSITTVADLLLKLKSEGLLEAQVSEVTIKIGFPPKRVEVTSNTLLEDICRSGDQIFIELATTSAKPTLSSSTKPTKPRPDTLSMEKIPSIYSDIVDKYAILRNVPDDNSCMFNAVAYAILGIHENAQAEVESLRSIVASEISSNNTYNELILGRPVDDYISWIQKPTSWGGAIELGILATHFKIALLCLDIETGKMIRFQLEDNIPTTFAVLVYSGIHYDVVARNMECLLLRDQDVCIFEEGSLEGDTFIADCEQLALLLQKKNFVTNTTTFRVRCLECYEILVGEMGASNHANKTGHVRFGEVKKEK